MVEYYVRDVGAAGSNPVTSTKAWRTYIYVTSAGVLLNMPLWWNRQTQGTLMFVRIEICVCGLSAESAYREICRVEVG